MLIKYKDIALILCEITDDLINDQAINFNNLSLENTKLTCRAGGGLATYCKHDISNHLFTITYGKKMIMSKFNENELQHWLTYREIIKNSYFSSDTSIASVLTHTICHEFSHLLQQLCGWHIKGSVHNPEFYKILNYFHDEGIAEKIKNELIKRCIKSNISLKFEYLKSEIIRREEYIFDINDEISFLHKKKTYNGKVIKINKKTIIVSVKSLFRQSSWKVPKHLVQLKISA